MVNFTVDDISYANYMNTLTNNMLFFYGMIFCTTGVFFNLASILVFSRKTFVDMSMGF